MVCHANAGSDVIQLVAPIPFSTSVLRAWAKDKRKQLRWLSQRSIKTLRNMWKPFVVYVICLRPQLRTSLAHRASPRTLPRLGVQHPGQVNVANDPEHKVNVCVEQDGAPSMNAFQHSHRDAKTKPEQGCQESGCCPDASQHTRAKFPGDRQG